MFGYTQWPRLRVPRLPQCWVGLPNQKTHHPNHFWSTGARCTTNFNCSTGVCPCIYHSTLSSCVWAHPMAKVRLPSPPQCGVGLPNQNAHHPNHFCSTGARCTTRCQLLSRDRPIWHMITYEKNVFSLGTQMGSLHQNSP